MRGEAVAEGPSLPRAFLLVLTASYSKILVPRREYEWLSICMIEAEASFIQALTCSYAARTLCTHSC